MSESVTFLDSLLAGQKSLPATPRGWLADLRGQALEQAHRLTVPTTHDEDWRFTDLSPLYALAFRAAGPASTLPADTVARHFAPEASCRIVFVDGHFAPTLSLLPAGETIAVKPLVAASETHGDVMRPVLANVAPFADDAFRAINTAYLQDGALVHAPKNAVARGPIQVLFVGTQTEVAVHPRVLIVAETGADLTVLEDHVAVHEGVACVNAVTEISVAPNARVRHIQVQRENLNSFHIANCAVRLQRDAAYESHAVAVGARISRLNHVIRQDGEGTHAKLEGLALIGGKQLADTHSFIDHAQPRGHSRQLHKCVVADGARAVFNGRVLVRPGAQQTDSGQESRNLLLSAQAGVDTKPQLEIFADDVKCSHGATVGQLDAEELFYLRTRGLDELAARNLLTYGFAAEIIDHIPLPSVVGHLRAHVLARTQKQRGAA